MDKNGEILMDCIDDRIEAFLRGNMSVDEKNAFKQELHENPELRNRAKVMAILIRELHAKNQASQTAMIESIKPKTRIRPLLWWAASAAAVIVLFFGIRHEQRYRTLESVVSPYYMQYDMNDVPRGDVDSATIAHLYGLFTQIQESRNVSCIIKELEPIYNTLDDDFTYNAYANDIAWNLALAYIKDGQIDKAIPILEKLKEDNPDTPTYNKAGKLIKKLSDL